jgi:hypothetical protein
MPRTVQAHAGPALVPPLQVPAEGHRHLGDGGLNQLSFRARNSRRLLLVSSCSTPPLVLHHTTRPDRMGGRLLAAGPNGNPGRPRDPERRRAVLRRLDGCNTVVAGHHAGGERSKVQRPHEGDHLGRPRCGVPSDSAGACHNRGRRITSTASRTRGAACLVA